MLSYVAEGILFGVALAQLEQERDSIKDDPDQISGLNRQFAVISMIACTYRPI